eukprot:1190687-Prorocentrum_minimum.AAC.3
MASAMPASTGGMIWHPLPQVVGGGDHGARRAPLIDGYGLWEAVTTMPAAHPWWATAYANSGVGAKVGKSTTRQPAPASVPAASLANRSDPCRASNATATPLAKGEGVRRGEEWVRR